MKRLLIAGWRVFHCDACGEKWESASRDYASPSGEECASCGEWIFPHAARADETLLCNEYGNLIKTYERKVFRAN